MAALDSTSNPVTTAADGEMLDTDIELVHTSGADLQVGVSWDFGGAETVDLDMSAIVFSEVGNVMDACYYNKLSAMNNCLTHSGDNRDGSGEGYDEVISIDLDDLPVDAKVIMFCVNAHSGGNFSHVESAFAEFLDIQQDGSKKPVGEVNIGASSMMVNGRKIVFTALIMAGVYRHTDSGKWHLRTIGKPAMGFNFTDSLDSIRDIADTMLDEGMKYERVLTNKGPTFDMKKGDVGVLPPNTKSVAIGLGWTVFGGLDLDASAMIVGGYDESTGFRKYMGCVMYSSVNYYGDKSSNIPFVNHSGDNTTGAGDGDDEVINVRLDLAPEEVQAVVFVVNVYTSGGSFSRCRNSYVALRADTDHDASDGKTIAKFRLGGHIHTRGILFAKLFRHGNGWGFEAMGLGCDGQTATSTECKEVILEQRPGVDIPALSISEAAPAESGGGSCCLVS